MKLSALSLTELCSYLHRAEPSTNISFSWFGSPQVNLNNGTEVSSEALSDLIDVTNLFIRSRQLYPRPVNTPEDLVEISYLTHRVADLEKLSKEEVKKANVITLIFYRLGEFLEGLSNFISYNPEDSYSRSKFCLLKLPLNTKNLNAFTSEFSPLSRDSVSNEPLYNAQQVKDMYRQLHAADRFGARRTQLTLREIGPIPF